MPSPAGVVVLMLLVMTMSAASADPLRRTLMMDDRVLNVEVADTPDARKRGLARRAALADGTGMLFVFERPRAACFWMKETVFPLRLVFIDVHGTIVQRALLEPEDERRVCARQAVPYALELTPGSPFERRLRVGRRISGLPGTAPIPAGQDR
ncbi:DUF192 domain-containing protein [Candidatus Macondimonas diazotrophica]|uniref:DUF192 domain-containing protein n=1 Tax=Candidatus Macondimonas diazotrophica TaxID=2305248 RepID=A0A4Z0FE61_9GAMM|nr:DUF192 domain-containing protein [Candidatus Macondimonas diazotrophica]NCU01935.1 DUF192 domain-containing protein [Candidatus Macondimonas diazotrophica]TFZ84022.1 DUF192 domain-containing protein [Candidatus Macondimonas diazotrophica]HBG51032.1 DUF192 domain-containing protein [Gammaproteobacteria bacterium]